MTNDIQFDEYRAPSQGFSRRQKGMVGWLIANGVVRNNRQANILLFVVVVILIVVAIVMARRTIGVTNEPSPFVPQPNLPVRSALFYAPRTL